MGANSSKPCSAKRKTHHRKTLSERPPSRPPVDAAVSTSSALPTEQSVSRRRTRNRNQSSEDRETSSKYDYPMSSYDYPQQPSYNYYPSYDYLQQPQRGNQSEYERFTGNLATELFNPPSNHSELQPSQPPPQPEMLTEYERFSENLASQLFNPVPNRCTTFLQY